MRSIIGFTPPRRGRIGYRDAELTGKRSYEISKLGISLVPQGSQIFPSLSVEENLTVVYRESSIGQQGCQPCK